MRALKTNSVGPTIYAEMEISLEELQLLEAAVYFALKNSIEPDKERLFEEDSELEDLRSALQIAIHDCEKALPLSMPKVQLEKYVAKFRKWLAETHTPEQIRENRVDGTGYPFWTDIETYFSEMLANKWLTLLDREDQKNLLFLIAQNWDCGRMIGWLGPRNPLSLCGNLTEKDFITLAKTVVELDGIEFDDAKSQFISSFKKFDKLSPEIEKILLTAYETGDEYVKRLALLSLAKLGFPDIKTLIKRSWETEESEHHRISCLGAIAEYLNDEDLLKEYLDKAAGDDRKYISGYIEKLKAERNLS